MTEPAQLLAHACEYPWGPAPGSCVFSGGELREVVRWDDSDAEQLHDRCAVLAYGSNASLGALTRKFGAGETILILRGQVTGCDVVYSAHISPYGAVPATLQGASATSVPVGVMWLSPEQLEVLHATEPTYRFVSRAPVTVQLDLGGEVIGPGAYVSRHGALRLDGGAVALEAVPARGRRLRALGQREVLDAVRRRLRFAGSLEEFVTENVTDPPLAARRTARLRADAVAFTSA